MDSLLKKILLNFLAFLMGCLFVFGLLGMGELFLRWQDKNKVTGAIENNFSEFITKDPILGRKFVKGFFGTHYYRDNGETVFSAEYRFDQQGYRITPVDTADKRQERALFFGCSFMFGLGVEQEETLPACFGREWERVLPLNFAVGGYGPQHMWLQLQDPPLMKEFLDERGFVIYGFIDHHIDRLLGEKSLALSWGRRLPWLEITEEGVLSRGFMLDRGSFVVRKLQSFHLGTLFLKGSNLFPYTEVEGLPALTHLLMDIKRYLHEAMPGYELIVFIYPEERKGEDLCRSLRHNGIRCFDYSNRYVSEPDKNAYFYKDAVGRDRGHPKAKVYADVAKWLAADLRTLGGGEETEEKEAVGTGAR